MTVMNFLYVELNTCTLIYVSYIYICLPFQLFLSGRNGTLTSLQWIISKQINIIQMAVK